MKQAQAIDSLKAIEKALQRLEKSENIIDNAKSFDEINLQSFNYKAKQVIEQAI